MIKLCLSCTSTWLGRMLINLNPGILLSLHITPTSSLCLQSETPIPLEGHCAKVFSLPVQCRLSNQMGPDGEKNKEIMFSRQWHDGGGGDSSCGIDRGKIYSRCSEKTMENWSRTRFQIPMTLKIQEWKMDRLFLLGYFVCWDLL